MIIQFIKANSFSKGAPTSACEDMKPRHGFEPQVFSSVIILYDEYDILFKQEGTPPAEIVLDQYTV